VYLRLFGGKVIPTAPSSMTVAPRINSRNLNVRREGEKKEFHRNKAPTISLTTQNAAKNKEFCLTRDVFVEFVIYSCLFRTPEFLLAA